VAQASHTLEVVVGHAIVDNLELLELVVQVVVALVVQLVRMVVQAQQTQAVVVVVGQAVFHQKMVVMVVQAS